ncbi:MAG: 1-hydroxycarotenoid 3,4-desaturase CrtD [Rubricella sp.]
MDTPSCFVNDDTSNQSEDRVAGEASRIAIVGAGIAGLSAALELAHAGEDVLVLDAHGAPGGKMRTVPSAAGPIDAGPTVFTMRHVFEELLDSVGETLSGELGLNRSAILARHEWRGGATLDLHANRAESIDAVAAFANGDEARRFAAFCERCDLLFDSFDAPMMRAPAPSPLSVTRTVMSNAVRLTRAMAPMSTMWSALGRQFGDQRLRQLFARYATYVGGSPLLSPALLMLIWASEERGVWHVEGGMHALARMLERLATARGAQFRYGACASRILADKNGITGVELEGGERIAARTVLFNGDPGALSGGLLGPAVSGAAPRLDRADRSLSAWVWTWATPTGGFPLAHHTVFFGGSSETEFDDLFTGRRTPRDPTLYICAQDRGGAAPDGPERLLMIMNAPADGDIHTPAPQEIAACQSTVFTRLSEAGLTLIPPERTALTTPDRFAALFPGTGGALYGANPHGRMKAFARPTARTAITGLYLCGGGCHPGPGVPMAALSGRHAAAAITQDRASTSRSIPVAMRGGISTGSAMTASTASPSSAS